MAFRNLQLHRMIRAVSLTHRIALSTLTNELKVTTRAKTTDNNFVYLEDPDTFGTLAGRIPKQKETVEDPGDIKEREFIEKSPLPSQQLTTRQYADLIKQYLKHKRLKEAIDVLEIKMLKEDRVKPENYIYNILIGACADVGYTKKAFKLFNDMKRRALKPTGDTYTCLFQACTNSPWTLDGLKNAKHLRELMIEKQIEPNLTNYNAMIKAFGRCGDLATAFKIVDEMIAKKIKIRVHTLNHLLHACITDKDNGLRHALVVWRKMLKLREKPNIYSFNLMLKCVKECNLGSKEDIQELVSLIREETPFAIQGRQVEILQIGPENSCSVQISNTSQLAENVETKTHETQKQISENPVSQSRTDLAVKDKPDEITLEFIDKPKTLVPKQQRTVPNLLSKVINMQQVLSLQEVHTVQDKFSIIGGQEDFLQEMKEYSVEPDIKTFTQMLMVIEDSREAEMKLLEAVKANNVKTDIDFYNMLIKKRCLRSDYDGAFEIKELIEKEQKHRKKKYFLKKNLHLKVNIMTYGVLAMACRTQEMAEKLLSEMKELQLKVNIQILGTLLRHGTAHNQFGYIAYILDVAKEENLKVNDIFIKHLEEFNDKCENFLKKVDENGQRLSAGGFEKAYKKYLAAYSQWLKNVDVQDALKPEHPWQQFRENYPSTVQRDQVQIVEPKKFYKRNRKFVKYVPKAV